MDSKALIERVRQRWPLMRDGDDHNRKMAAKDMQFLYVKGAQWEDVAGSSERGDRPKYEFNELKIKAHRIRNEIRANPPQWKVRAVEDGDSETAEVNEGLLRNIWSISNGDHIIDYASAFQVGGGMGAFRVDTDYSNDDTFDQDIRFKAILNPYCLWWDPSAKDQLKRDAKDWFYTERISKAEFERRWPKAEVVSIDDSAGMDDKQDWLNDDGVRIGEYWWKEPATKTLCLLTNGKTVEKGKYDGQFTVTRERKVKYEKIMMAIVGGGDSVLEPPTEWAGKHFPFVVVFGEYLVIEGEVHWYGITRDGVDAQQGFNAAMTSAVEAVNSWPNSSKFWATAEQAKGNLQHWAVAHKENLPYLIYNTDPRSPGPPQRMGAADVPVALIQLAGMMRDNIKATTGVFDASVGQQSNETSGRAIQARQNQGEIANFHFRDNMALGVQFAGEIAQDLIGKIYDAPRAIRILGADLGEKYVKINEVQPDPKNPGKTIKVNDLTTGKYDLTVTTGQSWSTRRQEAAQVYTDMGQSNPALWQVAGDLLFRSMDLPYADQIAERMKTLLPPQIQQTMEEGKDIPPEVAQLMAKAQQAMQQVEQQGQLVQAAAAEAEKGKTEAEKAQLGVKSLLADLEVERARFDANVEKQMAAIATKQAAMTVAAAQLETKLSQVEHQQAKDEFEVESSQAAVNIQSMAQEFQQTAREIMEAMQAKEQELNGRIDQEIAMLMQSPQPAEPAPVEGLPA